jgi:hypothetical protein
MEIQIAGEWTGYTINDLIRKTLKLCFQEVTKSGAGIVTGDFSRYEQTEIIEALNEANEDISLEAKLAETFAFIRLLDGQRQYPLPKDLWCLKYAWYFDTGGTPWPLKIYDMRWAFEIRNYLMTLEGSPPEFIYPGDSYGNIRKIGVYPIPGTDGTAITFSAATGAVTGSSLGTFVGEITGQHKAGYVASPFLVDSAGRNFVTLGAKVGMMIFNVSDGSSGQITAIGNQDATNDKVSVTLTGGTLNYWTPTDSFELPAGEYGEIVSLTSNEEYIFSSTLGGITGITPQPGNLMIQYTRYPGRFTDVSQYPEMYKYFQKALPYGAAGRLLLDSAAAKSEYVERAKYCQSMFQDFVNKARRYEAHTRNRRKPTIKPLR